MEDWSFVILCLGLMQSRQKMEVPFHTPPCMRMNKKRRLRSSLFNLWTMRNCFTFTPPPPTKAASTTTTEAQSLLLKIEEKLFRATILALLNCPLLKI